MPDDRKQLDYETWRARARGPSAERLTVLEIVFATCGAVAILAIIVGVLAAYFTLD